MELLGADALPEDLRELLRELDLPGDFFKFSIWYSIIDTNNEHQRGQLQGFLIDPLSYLHPAGARDGGELALPPLDKSEPGDWKVVTRITNHHKALNPRLVFLAAFVDPESPTVHLTLHKQNA
jgi:hypothetical protein